MSRLRYVTDHNVIRDLEAQRAENSIPAALRVRVSTRDREIIHAIGIRTLHIEPFARRIVTALGRRNTRAPADHKTNRLLVLQQVQFDLLATHGNGCELDLQELLLAPQDAFLTDLTGIMENLNRRTGRLMNDYRPKYIKNMGARHA